MEFKSILDLRQSPYKDEVRPSFYMDFNLYQIIESIKFHWGDNIASFYTYLPADTECEKYRREIFQDIKKGNLYEELMNFVSVMARCKEAQANQEEVRVAIQKAAWHVSRVALYGDAFTGLYKALQETDITSEGFKTLRDYLADYLEQESFKEMYRQAGELQTEMRKFRFKLFYENDLIVITEAEVPGTYESYLEEHFEKMPEGMKNPFAGSPELNLLEQKLMEIVQQRKPAFFKSLTRFYKNYEQYAKNELLQFTSEITFYLSYYKFMKKMEEYGYRFAAPEVCREKRMYANGLYDLALACVYCTEDKEVVSNDMEYGENEQFFVVTGPNQGGKTTFARSLGQLVYFTKMGLDVPAMAANVHPFSCILTHFSVEESVETGRGKLQEELVRLRPMMSEKCENAFVVINELFTTAANYDAIIMGQKVLQHFIGQRCRGIYVTHLKELADAHEQVVSLRALLDENGIQTHKIARKEAGDEACAINQVNKYRLSYEQLKERLS